MLLSMQYLPGSRNGFMCRKLLNSKVILHSNMPNRCNINLLPSHVLSQMTPQRCWQSRRTTIRYAISSLGFWFTWFLPHMPRDSDFSTDTFLFTLKPNQQASKESFTFFLPSLYHVWAGVNYWSKCQPKSFTLLPSEIPEVDFKQKSKLCLRENRSKSKSSFTWHSLCCLQDVSAGMPSPPRLCALGRSWHGWGTSREEKRCEGKVEEMRGSHRTREVTIHSEPSSCRTRGWSHHPALPRLANDENHTKGWSHSCPLRWGCPKEKAHKSPVETTVCLQVCNPKEKVLESRSQTLPAPSSSSMHHSVHQSKTKPGLNPDLRWCKAFLQALWTWPEVKERWPWGWRSLLLSCVRATQPTVRPKEPRERIPANSAIGSGLQTKTKARSALWRRS